MAGKRDDILRAAMKGVRLHGLDGVRIQHIGKLAGTVTSNIYAYFNGKEDLMHACFDQVDRQIAQVFDQIKIDPRKLEADPESEVRRLWTIYYRWLVRHPDETVFYHRYRDSPAFLAIERERDFSYFSSFINILQMFQNRYHIYDRVDQRVLWLHTLTGTVMYAKNVVEGVLPDTQETEESIFRLTMEGLQGLFAA